MKRLLTALLCLFSIVAARAEDTKVYYGYCPQTLDTQYLSAVGTGDNGQLQVSICLDPSPKDAVMTLKQQGITQCTTVCDGQMLQSPIFRALGLYDLPDNLIIRNGRIAAMHVTNDQFRQALEK